MAERERRGGRDGGAGPFASSKIERAEGWRNRGSRCCSWARRVPASTNKRAWGSGGGRGEDWARRGRERQEERTLRCLSLSRVFVGLCRELGE